MKTPDDIAKVYFAKSLDGVFDPDLYSHTVYGYAGEKVRLWIEECCEINLCSIIRQLHWLDLF
jgi:hypothetical protein